MIIAPSSSFPTIWFNILAHHRIEGSSRVTIDDCDCDCACSTLQGTGNTRLIAEALHQLHHAEINQVSRAPELYLDRFAEHTLAFNPVAGEMVVLDDRAAGLLPPDRSLLPLVNLRNRFPGLSEPLFEQAVAMLLALRVLDSPQVQPPSARDDTPQTLTTWLHLTSACTLACAYCYVPRRPERLSVAAARRSVEAVFRSARANGFSQVRLKYAGGEPTLNLPALYAAQSAAEELADRNEIGLHSILLTNGLGLTSDLIAYLRAHAIDIMVSLDGLEPVQQRQRPLPGGGSSFPRVAAALDHLAAAGISPRISVTLTGLNLDGLPDLVDYLLERDLHFQLNFYRPPAAFPDPLFPEPAALSASLAAAYAAIERRLPAYSLLSGLLDRVDLRQPHRRPCGAGRSFIAIDQGQVAPCQMELGRPVADITAQDPLHELQAHPGHLQNLPVEDKDCAACAWRYRCAGGCPRLALQAGGSCAAGSPYCGVYQSAIPTLLRLEALRLIRHQAPWPLTNLQ